MDRFVIRKRKAEETFIPEPTPSTSTSHSTSQLIVTPSSNSHDKRQKRRSSSSSESSGDSSSDNDGELKDIDVNEVKKKKSYKQKYKHEWSSNFGTWLTCTPDKSAYCKVCSKSLQGGITHIQRHEKSKLHLKKLKIAKSRPLTKIDDMLTTSKETVLAHQLRSAEIKMIAFLAEHNLPFSTLDHLGKFIASVCPDSTIAKSIKCQRKKATNICLNIIAPKQLAATIENLNKSFFSIIVDETTDVSVKKSLVIVTRYFKAMKVTDSYLSLVEINDGTAEALFKSILNFFENNNINVKNLLGLAADNASVMQGNKSGLKARFQQVVPHIFVLGCICHSLNLCSSAACTKLPKNVEKFCRDICNYFAHSAVRSEKLKKFQAFCKAEPHRILKLSQTRWLSLQSVISRILEQWDPLTLFFTSETTEMDKISVENASAILGAMKNPIFKLYFLFLNYTLDLINKLNLEFQSEKLRVHKISETTLSLYRTILSNYIQKDCIAGQANLYSLDASDPRKFLPLELIYYGAKCEFFLLNKKEEIDKNDLHSFRIKCLDFYIELSKQIKSRFDFNDAALRFANILDPQVVFSEEFPSIIPIIHRFPVLCSDDKLEDLQMEWRLLRQQNRQELTCKDSLEVEEFWHRIFTMKNGLNELMFPNLKKVISGLMCLPHSSAAAERIFSQLALIKSKQRNRLRIETCDALLQTKEMIRDSNCFTFNPPSTQSLPGNALKTTMEESDTSDNVGDDEYATLTF